MATFSDGDKLAAKQLANSKKFADLGRTEHGKMINELYVEDYKALSGKVSERSLVEMGHPYGRGTTKSGDPGRQRAVKGSKRRLPAMPINTQTGKLRDSLRIARCTNVNGQTLTVSIGRGVRYAKYVLAIGGTRKMVTRPYRVNEQKRWRRKNFDLLTRMRALQKKS